MYAIRSYYEFLANAAIWSAATVAAYLVARALHRKVHHWALSPLIVAPSYNFV